MLAESQIEFEPTAEASNTNQSGLAITVEHLVYGLIAILAIILRYRGLGTPPLSPDEAKEALGIWQNWQAGSSWATPASPIYFLLSFPTTLIAGLNDFSIRFVPAFFGVLLVFLPGLMRHRLGRIGALVASLLLAVSPLLVVTSRMAGGIAIATFASSLIIICWIRYQESSSNRWLIALTIALVTGVLASSLIYSFLFATVLAWFAQRFLGPALFRDENGERREVVLPTKEFLNTSIILAVILLILGGSALIIVPTGIGATAEIAVSWLKEFQHLFNFEQLPATFSLFFRFSLGLVLLGLPAAIWAARNDLAFPIFLVYLSTASILLILLQPQNKYNLLVLLIPGYLLIGRFVNDQVNNHLGPVTFAIAGLVLVLGFIAISNLIRFGRLANPDDFSLAAYYGLLFMVALILGIVLITIIWSFNNEETIAGAVIGILVLLVIYSLGSASWLAGPGYNDTRVGFFEVSTDDDVIFVKDRLVELSWALTNSPTEVAIVSTIDSPSLRWYLRDFTNLAFSGSVPKSTDYQIVISSNEDVPPLPAAYIGTDFSHLRRSGPHPMDTIYQRLRWWLFHDSTWPIEVEDATLWIRADAIGGQDS